ncbi:hypothetical protein [Prochlorococcus sp. MIT 1307]|uniref:hypothetical protein n=1 Tax=Prochlorococcus sp. MIT 1307 TaxID=3096219 RepID=UPI002A75421D|nr:hypothetical protein [Prochlorococcus sp. MIT 1307]
MNRNGLREVETEATEGRLTANNIFPALASINDSRPLGLRKKQREYRRFIMESIKFWQNLSDENKSLVKGIALAAFGLYVLLQLATLLLPMAIIAGIGYWAYKAFIDKNPKVFK